MYNYVSTYVCRIKLYIKICSYVCDGPTYIHRKLGSLKIAFLIQVTIHSQVCDKLIVGIETSTENVTQLHTNVGACFNNAKWLNHIIKF